MKFAALALAALVLTFAAYGQTAPPIPDNHVDVIGFWDPNSTPAGSVTGTYSHKIGDNTVSISMADVTFKPFLDRSVKGIVNNVTQARISTTSGLGQRVMNRSTFGWDIFAVGAIGAQTTPGGGSAAGFSSTAGFVGARPVGSKGLTIDWAVRIVAGTGAPQYIFGLGFGFGR